MDAKISVAKLNDVAETLLIPLYCRAKETQRPDAVIQDPKAVEIVERIEYDFDKFKDWIVELGVTIRTEILDEQVKKFLDDHPESVVVNIACGLDTRFTRLDNGKVMWFELDLPESIEVREHFLSQSERNQFIAVSVLDPSWIEKIPKEKPTLFIVEGLFMYFTKDEVKEVFEKIANHFESSQMLLEMIAPYVIRRKNLHNAVTQTSAIFKCGVNRGAELELWGDKIKFVKEWFYFDRHRKRMGWKKYFSIIPRFRRMAKIIHLRFE